MSSPQILIDPAEISTPTIDYRDVVQSTVNIATFAQNYKLNKITNTMEIQQQQFTNIMTAPTGLTEELKKNGHPQTNPQYQPTSPSESQQQNSSSASSSHHSSHNASVEAWHPSNNASVEARLPHNTTTTGPQQNLQHHNTPAGVWCPNNKNVSPNIPKVTDDDTEGSPSLSVHVPLVERSK